MSKFITGKELQDEVYDIIWDAKEVILIVSPFIKLDEYFKELFDKHLNNPKIHLLVVFGKNQKNISKSLSIDDLGYFKKFLNVSIVYVPNLHAKYYANESKGVVTSINLYDASFKNNIAFGIFSEVNFLNAFTKTTDHHAWEKSWEIAENSEAVFIKRPVFEKNLLSALIGKNYIKSEILHDTTEKSYSLYGSSKTSIRKITDFPEELILGSSDKERPVREQDLKEIQGFCIRTGTPIPFNLKKPFSEQAYKSWVYYKNVNFPEKYCHKTGKESYGKTSMHKPTL